MANVSVLIVDKAESSIGLLANISFVLGLTASKYMPIDTFGDTVVDGDGKTHRGLTCIAHHVREAGQSKIRALRDYFSTTENVYVTDYTRAALPSSYEQYTTDLQSQTEDAIQYIGIHVFGPEEIVVPKTKSLSRR